MSYTVYENSMEWNYNAFRGKTTGNVLYDYFGRESYDSGVKFKTYEEAKKYFNEQVTCRKELQHNHRGNLVFIVLSLLLGMMKMMKKLLTKVKRGKIQLKM